MQLDVWKFAHTLVLDVYNFASTLLEQEKYGLISQMRQAAVSVHANIAQGSLKELRYYFILASDLVYKINLDEINIKIDQISRMLSGLIGVVRN